MTAEAEVYRPQNSVRVVTATSLFDGHEASINIFRRILQATGVEVTTPAGSMAGITAEQAKTLEQANYSSAELDALYTAVANLHKSQATLDQLGNVSALMQGFAKS